MKRYYISPVIGDGSEDNPFRAKTQDHGVNNVAVIPTGADGKPLNSWALVVVAARNHGQLLADKDIHPLPDFPFDAKLTAMHKGNRDGMISKLQARGIDTSFLGSADGYRDVIRGIGKKLAPDFDENNFDISE